jgi:DNA-binding PadR family transcriptional regulator
MSRDAFSFDPPDPRGTETRPADTEREARSANAAQTASSDSRELNADDVRGFSRQRDRTPEAMDSPQAYYLRDRTYFVRDSEFETLREIGTFRVVAANDFARSGYKGDAGRMEREVRRLKQQGLLSEKTIETGKRKTVRIFTLTKTGKRLLEKSGHLPDSQALYHGLVKPREAKHDAELYQLYQREAARIERAGGRPLRVVLDYELKRNLNRDLAALGSESDVREARQRIAELHGLSIVNGRIQVPDIRVEYETAEMDRKHVDLELATRNYRPRSLAEKAKAGFSLYAPREDASRLRRILDQNEITAEILSL